MIFLITEMDMPRHHHHSPSKTVAIAVPLSSRTEFTDDEKISLHHLLHHLGRYDRYFILQEGLTLRDSHGFQMMPFGSEYFGSVQAHRKLLFSEGFYMRFHAYEYILIYHLDALVFSDRLMEWCRAGYDYIAPPWIPHKDAPYARMPAFEGKVGNGGFSLRRVAGFLDVLRSRRLWRDPWKALTAVLRSAKPPHQKAKSLVKHLKLFLPAYNGVRKELDQYTAPEDQFWANRAAHYAPGFRISPLEEALSFAFECVPRYCYERNGNRLPFGCHAWERYDRAFWEPFLLVG
jgi:hypothetical protein